MKEYMESKINDFEKKHNPETRLATLENINCEIRRSWKAELENKHINWRKIKTNEDVYNLINRFGNIVSSVEKIPYGSKNTDDEYVMLLAEYKALQGLRKLSQFTDCKIYNPTDFKNLSKHEIDKLFDKMEDSAERMDKQINLKAMQD